MKSFFNLSILLSALFFVASCGEAPKGEKTEASAAVEVKETKAEGGADYTVNATNSKLYWEGTKLMGGGHEGTINIQSGNISVKDGEITGGSFVIDMQSIANTDIEDADDRADLEGHLKNGDFFDVPTHATAKFEITSVIKADDKPEATHNVTGNLTIKGITKSITIPVSLGINETAINVKSLAFTINRTEWDVKYSSGLLGTAKDRIINDEVGMRLVIDAAIK